MAKSYCYSVSMEIFVLKHLGFKTLSHSSKVQNHALMHRGGLTLSSLNLPLSSPSTTSRELLSQFSTCNG